MLLHMTIFQNSLNVSGRTAGFGDITCRRISIGAIVCAAYASAVVNPRLPEASPLVVSLLVIGRCSSRLGSSG